MNDKPTLERRLQAERRAQTDAALAAHVRTVERRKARRRAEDAARAAATDAAVTDWQIKYNAAKQEQIR